MPHGTNARVAVIVMGHGSSQSMTSRAEVTTRCAQSYVKAGKQTKGRIPMSQRGKQRAHLYVSHQGRRFSCGGTNRSPWRQAKKPLDRPGTFLMDEEADANSARLAVVLSETGTDLQNPRFIKSLIDGLDYDFACPECQAARPKP